jgi:hypothetical protein
MTNLEERDRIRALVLRAFYDINEEMPGNVEQTGVIADRVGQPKPEVDRATLYLSQRGLVRVTENQGFLDTPDRLIMAEITSAGVDVIERPEQAGPGFLDAAVIRQLVVINNPSSPTFHNYGPVGVQQVGDSNTASVNQTSSADQRSLFVNAAAALQDQLSAIPDAEREEVQDHLASIDEQLQNAEPKASRLRTAFSAIGRIGSTLAPSAAKAAIESITSGVIKALVGSP